MQFENPCAHKVTALSAEVIKCRTGSKEEFGCLTISLHGDGEDAKIEIYFNYPHHEMAEKYAAAIKAVRS